MDRFIEVPAGIYKKAESLSEIQHRYRMFTPLTTGGVVAEKVYALMDQMDMLRSVWAKSPQSVNDRVEYEKEISDHQVAIAHLEGIADKALINDAVTGGVVGIGYTSPDDPYPVAIPKRHWPFLEIDFEEGIAKGKNIIYAAVRVMDAPDFIRLMQISETDESEEAECPFNLLHEERLEDILNTALAMDIDLKVPGARKRNDKQKIRRKCSLPESAFGRAWQYGLNRKVIWQKPKKYTA
ncbi:MAG: hypothetical protein JMN24_05170 [gamma proteobacterium endosymbiont of Lamellibrachia anaximandri]|nr:hypothetical protein [gamma proteobacterium endosymbiont of Lamellibrachia anaximandri]MBL3616229.1 hypothetical protein [gamma proteobacterium endosymbiont of Lamellibrachia anaximandri]